MAKKKRVVKKQSVEEREFKRRLGELKKTDAEHDKEHQRMIERLDALVEIPRKVINQLESVVHEVANVDGKVDALQGWQEDAEHHLSTKVTALEKTARKLERLPVGKLVKTRKKVKRGR